MAESNSAPPEAKRPSARDVNDLYLSIRFFANDVYRFGPRITIDASRVHKSNHAASSSSRGVLRSSYGPCVSQYCRNASRTLSRSSVSFHGFV